MTERLVFVYNANAGLLAGALDSIHKTVSPDTYACNLCAVTHGLLTMRPAWRKWLKSLAMPVDFYHRPDFRAAFPALVSTPLPLIGKSADEQFSILLDADALSKLGSVDALVATLQSKLAAD